MKIFNSLLILIFLITSPLLFSQTYWEQVTKVYEGDIFEITSNKIILKIRLNGVDCPELNQQFGDKAKEFTKNECLGKKVTVYRISEDRFGTIFADVKLPDGRMLNEEILRKGLGWVYQPVLHDFKYKQLEIEAKKEQVGLWSEKNPIPPWDYRKGIRVSSAGKKVDISNKDIYRSKKGGYYYINKYGRRVYIHKDSIERDKYNK